MRAHHAPRWAFVCSALTALSFTALTACGAPEEGALPPEKRAAPTPDPDGEEPHDGAGGRTPRGDLPGLGDPPDDDDGDGDVADDEELPPDDDGLPIAPGPEDPQDPAPTPGVPVSVDPTAPTLPDGTEVSWPEATLLDDVSVTRNRDSALITVPPVQGAADYRAFVLTNDVGLDVGDGGEERVLGATVHCAGQEQHNAPFTGERVPLRTIEVTGVTSASRVVVEALDTACPFPGVVGAEHADIDVTNYALGGADRVPFSIFTEDEVRQRYGSLIVNGHRQGAQLGAPASDEAPRVLARTTVSVSPKGGAAPTSDFFAGFANDGDQPAYVGELPALGRVPQPGQLYENSQLTFATYGMEHTQFFVDRGQLHTLLADWEQDVFATAVAYPKRAAAMNDDSYVHVTFEVPSNATARRYWWLSLCGAAEPGQTLDENGHLRGNIIQTPFFYQNDGKNPSVEKWSCLQLFPRDGLPNALPPTNTRPESDLRVMVNVAGGGDRDSVRNVSPAQYPSALSSRGWYRQMDADGELVAPILDDHMRIAPKTRYDVYVRDDRVIVYVDGQQRLCNDFPSTPLTMAEAAVGFGQVLYHSAAERVEFSRPFNDRTGQRYYLENTPYLDARAWDNLGFDDGVAAPAGFDAGACYVHGG